MAQDSQCSVSRLQPPGRINWNVATPRFRDLSMTWLREARGHLGREIEAPREMAKGFLALWIAFNNWTSHSADVDPDNLTDSLQVRLCGNDNVLRERYATTRRTDSVFRETVDEFASLWPVFDVRRISKHWNGTDRRKYVRATLTAIQRLEHDGKKGPGDKWYLPYCEHSRALLNEGAAPVPADWPHLMQAIYQVRCNLFHGGKTFGKVDMVFIRPAFKILWNVWGEYFFSRS